MSTFGKRKKMSSRKAGSSRAGKRLLTKGYASFKSSRAAQGVIGRSPATRGSRTRGVEVKSLDFPAIAAGADVQVQTISTTATFDLLNGVVEGASFYNRVGRRTHMKSVHITGFINETGNGGGVPEYLRVMLVYDRQPNGNFPAIADLLLDYGSDGTTFTTSISKLNMNNVERFAIIRDTRLIVPNNSHAAGVNADLGSMLPYGESQCKINMFVPLKDLETHYKANAAGINQIGNVATGGLYLVTIGNVAAGANGYQIQYNARLRYIDI